MSSAWIVWQNRYGGGPRFAHVEVSKRTEKFVFIAKELPGLYTKRLALAAIKECKDEAEAREEVASQLEGEAQDEIKEAREKQAAADAIRKGWYIDEWGKVSPKQRVR